ISEDVAAEETAEEFEDEPEEGEAVAGAEAVVTAQSPQGETPESGPATQTASIREQGGRSMHRMSRRMRRRRGGNRFGAQAAPAAVTEVTQAVAGAPAVEVRPEPEARPEVRTERVERPERAEQREERSAPAPERVYPSITDLLKAGQEIIVQIAKEPLGQ